MSATAPTIPPATLPVAPLRYEPRFEVLEDDEAQTEASVIETMRRIQQTTLRDEGRALRSVHAKSHGLLCGELQVLPDLPAQLAQGLYAQPARYPVVLRFSTNPGDLLDDSITVPRGLAIKVIGVPGERLPGSEHDTTQDYVLVDGPAFMKSNAKGFVSSLKMTAATTDKMPGTKNAISTVMRGVEKIVEAAGGKSPTAISLGGHPMTHLLGETYHSQAPLLHGPYMAKVAVRPLSPALKALKDQPLDVKGKPNGLREAVVEFFGRQGAEWELCVQLCTDLDAMPIEDAKVVWPEDRSPLVPVARLVVPAQPAWSDSRVRAIDDGLSFSPWHGVAAHRPVGSVMRARKRAYEMARQFRAEHNGMAVGEPKALEELRL